MRTIKTYSKRAPCYNAFIIGGRSAWRFATTTAWGVERRGGQSRYGCLTWVTFFGFRFCRADFGNAGCARCADAIRTPPRGWGRRYRRNEIPTPTEFRQCVQRLDGRPSDYCFG